MLADIMNIDTGKPPSLDMPFVSGTGVGINSISQPLTMAQLCRLLEGGLDRPLVDETRLTATYQINVHSEVVSTREFLQVLCDWLGLTITPGRRDVSILVVRDK